MGSLVYHSKYFRKKKCQLTQPLSENTERKKTRKLFYKASKILISKPDKYNTGKENYIPMAFIIQLKKTEPKYQQTKSGYT